MARRGVQLRIHSDCAYVVQGFERLLLGGAPRAKHAARWTTAADLLAHRRADTKVFKLRAHRAEAELHGEAWEGWWHAVGSQYADSFACLAAHQDALPPDEIATILARYKRATQVWRRLALVGAAISRDAASARPPRAANADASEYEEREIPCDLSGRFDHQAPS